MKVPSARILVIDDDPEVVDLLAACLREEGYGISGALTSDEGVKDFVMSRPDVVLLDILLPGMNGIEVLKRVRSIEPTAEVIMVTGSRTCSSPKPCPARSADVRALLTGPQQLEIGMKRGLWASSGPAGLGCRTRF